MAPLFYWRNGLEKCWSIGIKGIIPIHFIEAKSSGRAQSPSLRYLKRKFTSVDATQVTLDKEVDLMTEDGIRICSAHLFLADLI